MVTALVGLLVVLALSVLVLALTLVQRTLHLERLLVLERHSSDVARQEKAALKEVVAIEIAAMVAALREVRGDAEVLASAKEQLIDQSRMFSETVERASRDFDETVSAMVCMMRECVTQAQEHFRQAEAARAALRRSEGLRLQRIHAAAASRDTSKQPETPPDEDELSVEEAAEKPSGS